MTLELVQVPLTGTRKAMAFVCKSDRRCEWIPIELKYYPDPEWSLRRYRIKHGLMLHQVANKLGISTAQVSGLERGSLRPAAGWDALVSALEAKGDS